MNNPRSSQTKLLFGSGQTLIGKDPQSNLKSPGIKLQVSATWCLDSPVTSEDQDQRQKYETPPPKKKSKLKILFLFS